MSSARHTQKHTHYTHTQRVCDTKIINEAQSRHKVSAYRISYIVYRLSMTAISAQQSVWFMPRQLMPNLLQDLRRAIMPGTSFPTNNDNFSNGFPMVTTQAERLLQAQNRRKFSFPATLHSAALLEVGQRETTRRRLSNVSDVVTRKLSYTIGWKAAQIPAQDIITQVRLYHDKTR